MSTAQIEYGGHPVSAAAARMHAELDALVDAGVWTMSPATLAKTLPGLTRLRARVAELELRVAHHADRVGLGTRVGAADTIAWWANTANLTKGEAKRLARLAKALDFAHEPVRDALAAGDLLVDQAQVIIDAVDALPDDLVDPELAARA
ncbi:MAG: HNH endonuclease signature motif containing protein, partial [Marmoricola sp.]